MIRLKKYHYDKDKKAFTHFDAVVNPLDISFAYVHTHVEVIDATALKLEKRQIDTKIIHIGFKNGYEQVFVYNADAWEAISSEWAAWTKRS